MNKKNLLSHHITTPLGQMLAIADNNFLYLLEFIQQKNLSRALINLQKEFTITENKNELITYLENELEKYFKGNLKKFQTPIEFLGTEFQKLAWQNLQKIEYGKTKSYLEQAQGLGKNSAYRAVANANAANKIAIIMPCHRVINSNGKLGGYAGGVQKKQWLLDHEKMHAQSNS
jgi:O-6-methylguanine DNA methyltransferase